MKTSKKLQLIFPVLWLAGFTFISCENLPKSRDSKGAAEVQNKENFGKAMKKDAAFAVEVADAGMFEIKLGELAQTNATSEAVKKFGREMVKNHKMLNEELTSVAESKNIVLPLSLSEKNQDAYNELSAKKGTEFDKVYTDWTVKDHKKAVGVFEKEADKGEDPDLKTWAMSKLTILNHHLEMAEELQKDLQK